MVNPRTHRRNSSLPRGGPRHGPGRGPGKIDKAHDMRGAFIRLAVYFKPYRATLAVIFTLVIAYTALGLMGPYLMGVAIDNYIVTKDAAGLLRIILLMSGSYFGSWICQVGANYIMANVAQKTLREVRRDLFEHLQTLSLSFFDRHPHGELMSRLTNDIDAINTAITQSITQLISQVLSMASIVVMMFVLNLWLTLGALAIIPLMFWLTASVAKHTRKWFRRLQKQLGVLNAAMEETVSGQRVVLAFRQNESAYTAFAKSNLTVRDAGIKAYTYTGMLPPLIGQLGNLDIAVIAGLGGWLALQGLVSVGTIATFISYARRFVQPLRHFANLYNTLQAALAGAERIFEIIDTKPELVDAPNAATMDDINGEVIFDHVDFSYLPGVPILKDINIQAYPGQTIALVGPTGAGKTTTVNLLSRFYDIDKGSIRIDGQDIRKIQKSSLRRQLGIVLQDTYLFSETVMENIRYGRLDASDEECIQAAKLANADQFIRRLPKGYKTELSERGSNLSQGQRQLLAIARAILADPSILILDEATSSVDTRTEVHIQEALLRLMEDRTSFVIAHRLSTIRKADQILAINDGRIIERGTHGELLEKHGFYHNMYMSQFKGLAV